MINNRDSKNTQWRDQVSIPRDSVGFPAGQRSSVVDNVWFCPLETSTWPDSESSGRFIVLRQVTAHWESSASFETPFAGVRTLAGCQNGAWCLDFWQPTFKMVVFINAVVKKRHQMRALWEPLIFCKTLLAPHLITLASREVVSNERKMDLLVWTRVLGTLGKM